MRNPTSGIKSNGRGAEAQGGVTRVLPARMPDKKEVKNIRKTALIIGIIAGITMAFLGGLGTSTQRASADAGPHVATGSDATPDKCASCHRIHTGQNEDLLKEAGSVEDFCYSCHGNGGPGSDLAAQEGTFYGGGTPGLPYGGKTASDTVGLRAGGFDEARINTTDPSNSLNPNPVAPTVSIGVLATKQPVNSNHAIDGTAGTMWGTARLAQSARGPAPR
jgi:predicted CXXCH cytochrome family protein